MPGADDPKTEPRPAPEPIRNVAQPAGRFSALAALVALTAVAIWLIGAAAVFRAIPERLYPPAVALACILLARIFAWPRWSASTRAATLAAGLSLVISVGNFRSMPAPDTDPTSQQPWELWRHGTLCLNGTPIVQEKPKTHWLLHTESGCIASAYPPGMAILAMPFYLPTLLTSHPTTKLLSAFDKSASSLLSALTVLLLALALARSGSPPEWIFLGASIYGLASSALSLFSQTLWQQTGVALALAAFLYAITIYKDLLSTNSLQKPYTTAPTTLAFLSPLAIALVRAPDMVMLVPLILVARSRRIALAALAGLACGALLFLLHNSLTFGAPFRTGYQLMQGSSGFTLHEFPESTVGLLISPTHGLLLYSPWVFTALLAFRIRESLTSAALVSALTLLCLMTFWWAWWGGDGFGPRMLSESQLPLAFALARLGPSLSTAERRLTLIFVLVAITTHAVFPYYLAADPHYKFSAPWLNMGYPWSYLYSSVMGAAG